MISLFLDNIWFVSLLFIKKQFEDTIVIKLSRYKLHVHCFFVSKKSILS